MGLFHEFKQFTIRGSALDMGVGVVLGAALSGFIDSLVRDILLPPVGLLISKMNIENLYISLNGRIYPSLEEAKEAGVVTINYGLIPLTICQVYPAYNGQ
ncbi:MscL family protein [Ornithinibacillus caprae]|uniref:MscL family protein n=1 Tax=Ornithinibacillus caprae TaxID=2678566 RepID=UPI001FEB3C30|nr:MscL family protein [Ornithinibacillus caprae]